VHQLIEAAAFLPDQIFLRNPDLLKADLGRIAGPDTELPVDLVPVARIKFGSCLMLV
jgi:hypothetical protein